MYVMGCDGTSMPALYTQANTKQQSETYPSTSPSLSPSSSPPSFFHTRLTTFIASIMGSGLHAFSHARAPRWWRDPLERALRKCNKAREVGARTVLTGSSRDWMGERMEDLINEKEEPERRCRWERDLWAQGKQSRNGSGKGMEHATAH